MKKKITSVKQCIAALGGNKEAANFMRVGESQVCNMVRDGCITSAHHMRVYFHLGSQGYEVDTVSVFGVDGDGSISSPE